MYVKDVGRVHAEMRTILDSFRWFVELLANKVELWIDFLTAWFLTLSVSRPLHLIVILVHVSNYTVLLELIVKIKVFASKFQIQIQNAIMILLLLFPYS